MSRSPYEYYGRPRRQRRPLSQSGNDQLPLIPENQMQYQPPQGASSRAHNYSVDFDYASGFAQPVGPKHLRTGSTDVGGSHMRDASIASDMYPLQSPIGSPYLPSGGMSEESHGATTMGPPGRSEFLGSYSSDGSSRASASSGRPQHELRHLENQLGDSRRDLNTDQDSQMQRNSQYGGYPRYIDSHQRGHGDDQSPGIIEYSRGGSPGPLITSSYDSGPAMGNLYPQTDPSALGTGMSPLFPGIPGFEGVVQPGVGRVTDAYSTGLSPYFAGGRPRSAFRSPSLANQQMQSRYYDDDIQDDNEYAYQWQQNPSSQYESFARSKEFYESMGGPSSVAAGAHLDGIEADDHLMDIPGPYYDGQYQTQWLEQDIDELIHLLDLGERYKWKYISDQLMLRDNKRVPALACQRKFKELFGAPEAESDLKSSLFYVAYRSGWKTIKAEKIAEVRPQQTKSESTDSSPTTPHKAEPKSRRTRESRRKAT